MPRRRKPIATPWRATHIAAICLCGVLAWAGCASRACPRDIQLVRSQTIKGVGAAQGVEVRDRHVYVYGDAETGVIVECSRTGNDLTPTGRVVRLTRNGEDFIPHPTGLTFHPDFGAFIGNTVKGRGVICHVDWDQMLADGNLDHAVLNETIDDLAINGTRPEFVQHDGAWLIATADYGDASNAVRFYDPMRLATAKRTSEAGVLRGACRCGAWVQNLHWLRDRHRMVLVQNQIEGRRWRIAIVDERDAGRHVFENFAPADELEGFHMLDHESCLFVTSSRRDNVWFGVVH